MVFLGPRRGLDIEATQAAIVTVALFFVGVRWPFRSPGRAARRSANHPGEESWQYLNFSFVMTILFMLFSPITGIDLCSTMQKNSLHRPTALRTWRNMPARIIANTLCASLAAMFELTYPIAFDGPRSCE
jgi:hypothetical protein